MRLLKSLRRVTRPRGPQVRLRLECLEGRLAPSSWAASASSAATGGGNQPMTIAFAMHNFNDAYQGKLPPIITTQ